MSQSPGGQDPGGQESGPLSFEQALEELEDCVASLESADLTLEESLAVFERGIAASRACARLLETSRQRVQVLVEEAGGDFRLESLDPEDQDALEDGAGQDGGGSSPC